MSPSEEEEGGCTGARQRGHVGSLVTTEKEDEDATQVLRQEEPKMWVQGRESGVSTAVWVLVLVGEKGSRQMEQVRWGAGWEERYRSREGRIRSSILFPSSILSS